ncbi:hypothetical protein [Pedobacter sp. MC2016-24]|uniref:hypothetical protein n=1 Tax=Pedobacter sp. MC2016-24 TaxID=2780090 RepID=UPI00187FA842|nr:hypothetical protein [Pedobacter sp. MC2016-24]MBE9601201.1 hypothetical protein [Pedobacter sp. MC2016-24]
MKEDLVTAFKKVFTDAYKEEDKITSEPAQAKLKSFEAYATQFKAEKLARQLHLKSLETELAEAKAAVATTPTLDITMYHTMMQQFNTISEKLNPVSKFFDNIQKPEKQSPNPKLTKEQLQDIEDEKQEALIKASILARMKK